MIQNNSLSSQAKFNQNQIKNTEVKKIRQQTSLVGLLGGPKNSCSHSKFFLCCSLSNVTPHNKFHPNRMKNAEIQIFEIFLKNLPKLNYWSQNLLLGLIGSRIMKTFLVLVSSQVPSCPKNGPTSANVRKKKTSFLSEDQKVELQLESVAKISNLQCIDMLQYIKHSIN